MKQTAVEYVIQEIEKLTGLKIAMDEDCIEQAKEMEKQQIIDACKYGNNFEQGDLNCHNYYDKNFKNK